MEQSGKLAYTVKEAAGKLSLSRSMVYGLILSGKIGSIKVGRARRITLKQIEKYLAEREHEVL